ncbi:HepT-like ribonuclease domain-containing protein [Egbenema bharatensis]|uniref:HepT-like ribonuclease domain-containing protein n=1 Tax=Egbenema bharatensis TaxID=3463334 RepID=UPI003A884145
MKVKNVALSEQTIANEIPAFCQKWKICQFSLFCPALPVAWEAGNSGVSQSAGSSIGVLVNFEPDIHPTSCDLVQMRDELTSILGQTVCLLPKEAIEQSENYIRRQQILDAAIVVYDSGCCHLSEPPELTNPLTAAEQEQALLLDVLIACQRIQRYTSDICWEQFQTCDCTLLQDATVRQLELIGEAIKQISQTTKTQHPEIPWSVIIDVCDCLTCEEHQAEAETIWQAVEQGIPRLIRYIEPLVWPGVPIPPSSDYVSSSLISEPA